MQTYWLRDINHADSLHYGVHPIDLQDLKACVAEVKRKPELAKGGNAPMYGMAASLPDRSIVGEFLIAFQNAQLEL